MLKYDVSDDVGNAAATRVRNVKVIERGDPDAGRQLARKKRIKCHNITSTEKKFGPGLKGVFNRKAGSVAGFRYSSSLRNGNWKWDKANLRIWLSQQSKDAVRQLSADPEARTKMKSKGVSGADVDNLIAFLKRN